MEDRRDIHEEAELVHIRAAIKDRIMQVAINVENYRLENIEYEMDSVMSLLTQLSSHVDVDVCLSKVKEAFDMLVSDASEDCVHKNAPNMVYTSSKGRPSYNIPEETLLYFIEKGFTLKHMSEMLSVSQRTISNRMEEYGLSIRQSYSSLSDEELIAVVEQKVKEFPSVGYKSMKGHLMSDGIRITESRIRRIMRAVDPLGVMLRNVLCRTYRIRRRAYSVRAPMALWHVDSNHKLIRWRFIFHGGIDGFSRLPVYMKVASDNTAATAFASFEKGVQTYGIPERVRTDKGMENIRIAEFMLHNRGVDSRSHITGRSVHNQRIERFWRELWQGCTSTYYELFRRMEQDGILDVDNEFHLLSLHLVYLTRIQSSVDRFLHAVSNRPLRTEHNKTLMQMWIMGQVLDPKIQLTAEEAQAYGMDYGIPDSVCNSDEECIVVPELLQVQEDIFTEINEILEQPVDTPFEVQIYMAQEDLALIIEVDSLVPDISSHGRKGWIPDYEMETLLKTTTINHNNEITMKS